MDDLPGTGPESSDIAAVRAELTAPAPSKKRRAAEKFLMAALGAIPWVGGFLSAAASIRDDVASERRDDLQTQWLDEHQKKINELGGTLHAVEERFEKLGSSIDELGHTRERLCAFSLRSTPSATNIRSHLGKVAALETFSARPAVSCSAAGTCRGHLDGWLLRRTPSAGRSRVGYLDRL